MMDEMNNWDLRTEIYRLTHQWYMVMVFMVVGSSLGLGGSCLWPAQHRATQELYVGLNAYRSPYDGYAASLAGQSFDYIDDYKHWQMTQLNEFVVREKLLEETLTRLRSQDPYWDDVTTTNLRKTIRVTWRNVGKWRLVVEMGNPRRATQVVQTWSEVVYEDVNQAVDHAKQVVALDIQMSEVSGARNTTGLRQESLIYVQNELFEWIKHFEEAPGDQAVTPGDHWEILGLVSRAATWGPAWDGLLEETPAVGSGSDQYIYWLQITDSIIGAELVTLPGKISWLDEQFNAIEQDYDLETANSYGLSSTLVIEKASDDKPIIERVGHPGTFSLVGGLIGLFIWGVYQGVRISRNHRP